jgi:protein translocase SecG subunit
MTFLPYIQIVLSIIIIILVLLQHSEGSAGGAFGQSDNWGNAMRTRRGAEKFIFWLTIILTVLFFASAIITLLIK